MLSWHLLWRLAPLLILTVLASPASGGHAAPGVAELVLGASGAGQPITAVKIGDGPRKFVLVGDTHGGPEANTFQLVSQLADYFRAHPEEVPPAVRLYIIPTLNPDGLAGATRFNAAGVDLNRNMNTNLDACPENDWSIRVQGARGIESDTGGPYPDSEPESRLIRSFLLDASAVIFYHSDGGDVFPAFCEHAPSIALAQTYAAATGYRYDRYWPNYNITGGMHDWASSLGIAAITPELFNGLDTDFEQNLAGVQAVLRQPEELMPLPEDHQEAGLTVPALIWRYWQAYGGLTQFGPPLAPAESAGGITRQFFERTLLELHPGQADSPYLVQPAALGRAYAGRATTPVESPEARLFPETGHTLRGAFASYWDQHDGMLVLGLPLSEEFEAPAADGARRTMQVFERMVLAYYPEDGSVRAEPLGWAALVRSRLQSAMTTQQIR
ncbi:MAG TPA: M14 family metallopeptidase [Roseiflexaceae bacterium]|nr:M14 family metallopeptidase [Roseiflexaceae bacterium]